MALEVDADVLMGTRRGRSHPRPQGEDKAKALREMLGELLRLGVIRVSTEITGAQVLLVAKKGTTKLRFCIDYRSVNAATVMREGWPIPDIKAMIERLGRKRAKFFGVMDLTSGFHQCPLRESDKRWTSFITHAGMYEWNRCPMGLEGVPSYFQRVMATNVLADILYELVECYLDDIIVFGQSEEQFLHNYREVHKRCRRANIKLNPKKCRVGLAEIEYLGHTISETKCHFTRSKRDRITAFPKPSDAGELKQFLGLSNYFHSHVLGLSSLEGPLNEMLLAYTKRNRRRVLPWSEKSDAAFAAIVKAIDECPALWFIDTTSPIYLQTDASDYGIGGFLFQLVNGEVRPVEFLSKTLSKVQRRWHTPDKEAYAIIYCLKRWDYLLRDVRFVLQTDHKNLTYLNFEGTAKVKRWKLFIQEYSFDIQYLEGPKNVVADGFSRLCSKYEEGEAKFPKGVAVKKLTCWRGAALGWRCSSQRINVGIH